MKNNIILQSRAERIAWVDGLRGIAILLVVLGHVNPPFKKIIYGFHMALFFIISGFFSPVMDSFFCFPDTERYFRRILNAPTASAL